MPRLTAAGRIRTGAPRPPAARWLPSLPGHEDAHVRCVRLAPARSAALCNNVSVLQQIPFDRYGIPIAFVTRGLLSPPVQHPRGGGPAVRAQTCVAKRTTAAEGPSSRSDAVLSAAAPPRCHRSAGASLHSTTLARPRARGAPAAAHGDEDKQPLPPAAPLQHERVRARAPGRHSCPGPSPSARARRRAGAAARGRARAPARAPAAPPRPVQRASGSKVSRACGSGTSAPAKRWKPANSLRRPSVTSRPSSSLWSVK